jgi:hypothetical protein
MLSSCGVASALHHLVCDLRAHQDDRGRLSCARLPAGSIAVLITTVLLTILIAVLMCVRVYIEGKLSGVEEMAVLLAIELIHRYALPRLRTQRDRGRPGLERKTTERRAHPSPRSTTAKSPGASISWISSPSR